MYDPAMDRRMDPFSGPCRNRPRITDLCTSTMRGRHLLLLLLGLFMGLPAAMATHNRAGEILICKVVADDPADFEYEVTVITYTRLSAPADRPDLPLDWGDGSPVDTIARTNIVDDPGRDLRRSTYVARHRYLGPGSFILNVNDPNRNAGVVNVPNSVNVPFCIQTMLTISPATGHNCSVRFQNPPVQDACLNRPWIHNPVAYDLDGDSLSYEASVCLGEGCSPIPDYTFPGPNYTIDPTTGTIIWDAPPIAGEYNIAFKVKEWRKVNGVWINVGWVMRDMQITVLPCANEPPQIEVPGDTCVVAGTVLHLPVSASDPDAGQSVTLSAQGQPLLMPTSPAIFNQTSTGQHPTGLLTWPTHCSHVRAQPYQVTFFAEDNWQNVHLFDIATMNIRVVAPPPLNPSATPSGAAMQLHWDASVCGNAIGYAIYRRNGAYGYLPGHCETGVPAYTGYTYIGGTTGVGSTSYLDLTANVPGNTYCYMVVALFPGGVESIASEEFCALQERQLPLITHVSVGVTDVSTGVDTVRWSNAMDLDSVAWPGPYQFRVYRGSGLNAAGELIWTSTVHPYVQHPDTFFLDQGIDTRTTPHVYRVELLGDGGSTVVGSSITASSVFTSTAPDDQQLTITWQSNTPWINSLYEVYRWSGNDWDLIGTTTTTSHVDTGLVNGQEYCYRVRSTGAYGDPDVVSPLLNYSQEVCGVPMDLTPPCTPTAQLDNDCEAPLNTLAWTDPSVECGDTDTERYHIWFSPTPEGPFELVAVVTGAGNTTFTHVNGSSVAGCYRVSAVDSLGNESGRSAMVCGDNCPEYTLPNVFTPNNDGTNDLFGPFPYRGVERIELQVFNRWGQVVFTTDDPEIGWRGTHQETGEHLPDGVYYYVCQVVFTRLEGEEMVVLKGHVQLIGGRDGTRLN
jgi:gliding motility-associated-like protein